MERCMENYINSGFKAFFLTSNAQPHSIIESSGDLLLKPLEIICDRSMTFRSAKKSYSYTHVNLESGIYLLAKKVILVVCLPLAILGVIIKTCSLLNSKTRDHYLNWMTSLQVIESMDAILNNSQEYIIPSYANGDVFNAIYPFRECACCSQSGNFNRLLNQRRQNVESRLLDETIKNYPPSETPILRYLSLGSGDLLPDMIAIGKLIKAGYKKIEVSLVDPVYKWKSFVQHHDLFKAVMQTYAQSKNAQVSINAYPNLPDKHKVHAVFAIDFDDISNACQAIVDTQKMLDKNGCLFLSYDIVDLEISTNGMKKISVIKQKSKEILDVIVDDMEMSLKKTNESQSLAYTRLGPSWNAFFVYDLYILNELIKRGFSTIQYRIVENGLLEARTYNPFDHKNVEAFIQLCLGHSKGQISLLTDNFLTEYKEDIANNTITDHISITVNNTEKNNATSEKTSNAQTLSKKHTSYLHTQLESDQYAVWKFSNEKLDILTTDNEETRNQLMN